MNQTAIRLLHALNEGPVKQTELMKILGIGEWQLNAITNDLIAQDYVEKTDSSLTFKHNAKTTLFRTVANQANVEKLLHDSNEQIFYNLAESTTIKNIQTSTELSLRTVQRAISELESIGVIKKENGKITIDNSKESLYLFAKLLKSENERKNIESYAEIIYQDKFRVLKKVPKGKHADGELTGFSLFPDYGIDYQTTHDYYIKQNSSLVLQEVLIHAILVAHKSGDKNAIAIAILFYLKNRTKMDPLDMRIRSKSYGISDVWIDMEGYVRDNPLKNDKLFLPRSEFEDKAKLYGISSELYTLPVAYPQLFSDLGAKLESKTEACLLGGENMRMKGLKDRTKDCDIVVTSDQALTAISKALQNMGYQSLNKSYFSSDDRRIDPFDILEHPSRSRIDLFKTRIASKLLLSDTMIQRATLEQFGKFSLRILSNEDIFLLKAVTLREGDIQDLAKISQASGFDWDVVWEELLYQEHLTHVNFSTTVLESLDFLHDQSGVMSPFYKRLIRRVLENEIQRALRDKEIPLDEMIESLKGGDIIEKMIRNRIDYLERKKYLTRIKRGNQIIVQAKEKLVLNVYSNDPMDVHDRISKHIENLIKRLGLSDDIRKRALGMADQISKRGVTDGRKPSGVAAAIVYLSCVMEGRGYTMEEIARAADLSQPSMGKLYRFVKGVLKL